MKKHAKNQKKMTYFLHVPMHPGELTIVKNTHAEDAMRHSVRLAHEANQAGLGVLLINCGMTDRRFREAFEELGPEREKDPRLIVHTASRGNLVKDRDVLEPLIAKSQIGVIIIVGWEWASDSYKRTRRLYTFLWEMMDWQDAAIVVYANAAHEVQAGKFDQRGLGKLALMAYATCEVNSAEKLEKLRPLPRPIVASDRDRALAERGVAELVKKINGLPGEGGAPGEGDGYAEAA
jgi:hypothetical protein